MRGVVAILQAHRDAAVHGADVGDARAHQARAEHDHLLDLARR